jgi:hypothetical protein
MIETVRNTRNKFIASNIRDMRGRLLPGSVDESLSVVLEIE